MAKELISRCDECGTSEDVEEFTITYGDETKDVDACPKHAKPLHKLFEAGTARATSPAPRKAGRSAHAVVPVEDLGIEA
ncbi:hypothetical protein J7E99_14915 [Streptomyces sp. ISL-44]|uniref:hypothetical protein n=1 Tax=Streptomyces sp. ISL-44 TaxID=2819184 RepID=UPI001BED3239|nr:hypothetical protein [Streptomyces sp. ISL-44]MBT2541961.1 hypothetical protein [Streptomyces sp. ISL-44]